MFSNNGNLEALCIIIIHGLQKTSHASVRRQPVMGNNSDLCHVITIS